MKVFIGADHRGFVLKEQLKDWLVEWGIKVDDLGAYVPEPSDDYTIYAQRVASMVADQKESRGILLCGSGVGVDVVANKFDGVRASVGKSADQIKAGRQDDDMNVLVIAADFTTPGEAKEMAHVFLTTNYTHKARYNRRLDTIKKIEANN